MRLRGASRFKGESHCTRLHPRNRRSSDSGFRQYWEDEHGPCAGMMLFDFLCIEMPPRLRRCEFDTRMRANTNAPRQFRTKAGPASPYAPREGPWFPRPVRALPPPSQPRPRPRGRALLASTIRFVTTVPMMHRSCVAHEPPSCRPCAAQAPLTCRRPIFPWFTNCALV